MGLPLTLAMLAAGVFLLYAGITGHPVLAMLRSIFTTGSTTGTAPARAHR